MLTSERPSKACVRHDLTIGVAILVPPLLTRAAHAGFGSKLPVGSNAATTNAGDANSIGATSGYIAVSEAAGGATVTTSCGRRRPTVSRAPPRTRHWCRPAAARCPARPSLGLPSTSTMRPCSQPAYRSNRSSAYSSRSCDIEQDA